LQRWSYHLNLASVNGKSINYDAFFVLTESAKKNKVKNFIYASSSSVYGVKEEEEVTEELSLEPLTDYSKYKALCEKELETYKNDFVYTIVRPSTVCGYSPRLRLDLSVNILTNHALNKGEITVFSGSQMRPNIHIEDMADLYIFLLEQEDSKIHQKVYNVGYDNFTINDIANKVKSTLKIDIPIKVLPTDDNRSYRVSSKKIASELGFVSKRTLEDAIKDLNKAFSNGLIKDPLTDQKYFNIKTMQNANLK